jgi:hypothetical protein
MQAAAVVYRAFENRARNGSRIMFKTASRNARN